MNRAAALAALALAAASLQAGGPTIDGYLQDPFWAGHSRLWTLADSRPFPQSAAFLLGYDAEFLYFAADISDQNVQAGRVGRKARVWEDDAVALLIHFGSPDERQWSERTFSYSFSAAGGANWARGPLVASSQPAESNWPPNWDSKVDWAARHKVGTTVNIPGNQDAGYVIEARIPWAELPVKPPFNADNVIGLCLLNLRRPEMNSGALPMSNVAGVVDQYPPDPSVWQRTRTSWESPLGMRGLVRPLPLGLGVRDLRWARFENVQADPQGPWLNREPWTQLLARMKSAGLNTLVLDHPRAAAALLPDPRPTTTPASAPEADRHVDQFTWILEEARANDIRVFLRMHADANGHDAQVNGATTQPASQPTEQVQATAAAVAMRQAAASLLNTYPLLAGLITGDESDPLALSAPVAMALAAGAA